MEKKLQDAFVSGLGLDSPVDFTALEFSKTEGWDSIGHMKLVAAIEETFGIRLAVNDLLGMNSYQTAKEIVQRYLE